MIEIEMPAMNNNLQSYNLSISEYEITDRPNVVVIMEDGTCFWFSVGSNIHAWFIEQNIKYKLTRKYVRQGIGSVIRWYIRFEKDSDAVLFKLTWC